MSRPRVFVAVDGSAANRPALQWAADYAARIGAELTLVTAWHWPAVYASVVPSGYSPEDDARTIAESAAKSLGPDRSDVRIEVVEGRPGPELVRVSEDADADVLVVGSRGHGAVAGTLLGSVSSYCVHHAHVPVVVVPSPVRSEGSARAAQNPDDLVDSR